MINRRRWLILFTLYLLLFTSPAFSQPKYEFRAAWIATVANMDWPSTKGLPSDAQKAEFTNILDALQRDGMNAVIVQIRPSADAFYDSKYEPWSEYLTGKQGVPPNAYYDPLQFMIEETHKRGMEFHAWINPYRAVFHLHSSSVAANHVTKIHPDWFITYGDTKYFNPGLPEVMLYLEGIVRDILTHYDIDGLHMDDYFYPYKIAGKEFTDNSTYLKYGNGLSKDDWRRSNCDSIIKYIHEIIVAAKPMVKFGISPFGVWRNKKEDANGSNTTAGTNDYDGLYANVLLWLREGWIDYVAPQLYWEIGNSKCDYETLVQWWGDHSYGKHVYIGHGLYKVFDPEYKNTWSNIPDELPNQISILRGNPNIQGSVFFSSGDLLRNPNGWQDSLQNNYYKEPALYPPMPWIDSVAPQAPDILKIKTEKSDGAASLKIEGKEHNDNETETIKNYVVYFTNNLATLGTVPKLIVPADKSRRFALNLTDAQIPAAWEHCYIAITCVDRENNESRPSNVVQLRFKDDRWEEERR